MSRARSPLGTAAVIVIYLSLNLLYLYVLPVGELAKVQGSVLDVIADRLLGARAGDIMGIVSIISLAASISAMTFAGPRVYYAMARDGVFFAAAAHIHPTYRTPRVCDCRAGGVGVAPGAVGKRRRADELHRFCDRALQRHCGVVALRAAASRAGRTAPFQGARLSRCPRDLRRRLLLHRHQRRLQPARSDGRRIARDGCRYPVIHVADTPTKPAGLKPGTTYIATRSRQPRSADLQVGLWTSSTVDPPDMRR